MIAADQEVSICRPSVLYRNTQVVSPPLDDQTVASIHPILAWTDRAQSGTLSHFSYIDRACYPISALAMPFQLDGPLDGGKRPCSNTLQYTITLVNITHHGLLLTRVCALVRVHACAQARVLACLCARASV